MVIAALISPIMVLKPSRRQKTILVLREEARRRGLQVQVMADAITDSEGHNVTSVRYFVPWLAKDLDRAGSKPWLLMRDAGRGRASRWSGWRWQTNEAPQHHQSAIDKVIFEMPNSVNAVSADGQGLGVYWREHGGASSVHEIEKSIKIIYSKII